jgi:hypothetical protein
MEWNGSRARTELMAAPELPRKVLGHRLSGASTPPRRQTSCRDDRWATQGRGVKSLLAGTAAHRFQAPPQVGPSAGVVAWGKEWSREVETTELLKRAAVPSSGDSTATARGSRLTGAGSKITVGHPDQTTTEVTGI